MAEIMEIRKEVLHALLHRAKKWIRKKFGAEYEEMQNSLENKQQLLLR